MLLHLGVVDQPYVLLRGRKKAPKAGTVTTGDVAGWLETRYHVMEIFYRENEDKVADAVGNSVKGAVESLMMGAPASLDPMGGAASEIEDMMKQFVATGEMDKLGYPGVPTQASLDRASGKKRSSRFKHRRATGQAVSFYDSGLYQASMKVWID